MAHRGHRAVLWLLSGAALAAFLVIMECAVFELMGDARYRTLESTASYNGTESGGMPQAEEEDPLAQALAVNSEVVGWLHVENPRISYPVVQAGPDKPADFYLSHDLWGARNPAGCPFLDTRANPAGTHLIIYAHRMGVPGAMFNDLARADTSSVFSSLGQLAWTGADGTSDAYQPVCSLRVDKRYAPIQAFSWQDQKELRAWLEDLLDNSTQRAPSWQALCARAHKVITLVTCTDAAYPDDRTLVVFAA